MNIIQMIEKSMLLNFVSLKLLEISCKPLPIAGTVDGRNPANQLIW